MAPGDNTTNGTTDQVTVVNTKKFDISAVEKLTKDNYRIWSMQMKAVLNSHGIFEIVNGTLLRPEIAGKEQKKYDAGATEAYTALILSLARDQIDKITGCDTAVEIWNKLRTIHQSSTGEDIEALWQKFYSVFANNKSPVDTMCDIQNYAAQLRSVGVELKDSAEVARVISALSDEKYRNFREAWRSMDSSKRNSEQLLSRLKTWESEEGNSSTAHHSRHHSTSTSTGEKAYVASNKRGGRKPRKTKEEIEELKKKTKCHYCKNIGHWKSDCRKKKKDEAEEKSNDDDKSKEEKPSSRAYIAGDLDTEWVNDSGADNHYCGIRSWFLDDFKEYSRPKEVGMANNTFMHVEGKGSVRVSAFIADKWQTIVLRDVEYVAGGANLVSENVLLEKHGMTVEKDGCNIIRYYRMGPHGRKIPDIQARLKHGLQIMDFRPIKRGRALVCHKSVANAHERFAHINTQFLKKTHELQAAYGMNNLKFDNQDCIVCIKTKMTQNSFKSTEKIDDYAVGECLHTDIGYGKYASNEGFLYFQVVRDQKSNYMKVYPQRTKNADETFENFKAAVLFFENQTGNTVKIIRSDNGCEYTNEKFQRFLSLKGIIHGTSAPYVPQQNGGIERRMRTLTTLTRAILCHSKLPHSFWADGLMYCCYVLNRTLNSRNREKTPHEMIFKKKPTLSHVHMFGSRAFLKKNHVESKWEERAVEGVLIGYNEAGKNSIVFIPTDRSCTDGTYVRQATNLEIKEEIPNRETHSTTSNVTSSLEDDEIFIYTSTTPTPASSSGGSHSSTHSTYTTAERDLSWAEQMEAEEEEEELAELLRRTAKFDSAAGNVVDDEYGAEGSVDDGGEADDGEVFDENFVINEEPGQVGVEDGGRSHPQRQRKAVERYQAGFTASHNPKKQLTKEGPATYKLAMKSPHRNEWKDAMDEEMESHRENGTWTLVPRPPPGNKEEKVLGSRWVLTVKTTPEGELERFKARFVAQGFKQVPGMDYKEVFAPTVRYESIRVLLSVAGSKDLRIKQFDIKCAFLNSQIEEIQYMEQADGYKVGEDLVCKLNKSIYGLKQSPRNWHMEMKGTLLKMGFKPLNADPCVFKKRGEYGEIFVAIYVDDGLVVGKMEHELAEVIQTLKKSYQLTEKPVDRFLGIEIKRTEEGIFISQDKYISDLLEEYNMMECSPKAAPMSDKLQWTEVRNPDIRFKFQELIGSLLFIVRCTRPDICYAVHFLSRFLTEYGEDQWKAAMWILKYLKGTKSMGILYKPDTEEVSETLIGFSDSDHGSDKRTRKSTSGCLFTYNGAPVIWRSKKQTCVALSSAEAEFVALGDCGREAKWILKLYEELGIKLRNVENPMTIYTDSTAAKGMSQNPEQHQKTKHIDIRFQFIRQMVERRAVRTDHIPETCNPADILTKAITENFFLKKRKLMGMTQPPRVAEKRRACSLAVDPKRPHFAYSISYLVWYIMTLLALTGATNVHNSASPVLWRLNHQPVVIGFHAVTMNIQLVSPCTLMEMEDVEKGFAKTMIQQCNQTYEDLFKRKLLRMCPEQKHVAFRREKRFVVAVGFVLIAVVACAGVGLGSYAISETYKLETRQEEMKIAMDELQRKVFLLNEEKNFLRTELRKVTSTIDQLINDFHIFKERTVETQYLVSHLTSKLMEGKKVLQDTEKMWKLGEMNDNFFEYLNFTMDCGEECPVDLGIFHGCSSKDNEVTLEFSVPIVNTNLTRLEADSFDLMLKKQNNTCRQKYTGPLYTVLSLQEDCIYETIMENPKGRIALASSLRCKNTTSFQTEESHYRTEECKASRLFDEREYIQVKIYNNMYYIYCPGSYYWIGKRRVDCPNQVFTLPLSLTFTLNDVQYKGNVLKIVYREREDPLLLQHINWHLNPKVNWNNLTEDFDQKWQQNEKVIQDEAKNLKVFEFNDSAGVSATDIVLIVAGTIAIVGFIACKLRNAQFCNNTQTKATPVKLEEEVPLQNITTANATHSPHRIIIES